MHKQLYAVRHVATGFVLPPAMGHRGRGGSFWSPTEPDYVDAGIPRIFHNKRAALAFISAWAQGEFHIYRSRGDWGVSEPEETITIKDVGRNKDMLVAVPIEIAYLTEEPS